MIKKRKFWSLAFVVFWVILFSFGISQVFLFLNGYNPFGFLDQKIQQGYATFSSDHHMFLNGSYLGFGKSYGRHPVREYSFCAESLGYQSRCYDSLLVRGNDESSLELLDIPLVKIYDEKSIIYWSDKNEKIYFLPDSSALFWYDDLKKQIFWVNESSKGVESYFPAFIPSSIEYERSSHQFILEGEVSGEIISDTLSFLSSPFSFLQKDFISQQYTFKDSYILQSQSSSFFDESNSNLISVFDESIERVFDLDGSNNSIIIFKNSIYLFSDQYQELQLLTQKDAEKSVVFVEAMKSIFFVNEGQLVSMRIL